MSKLRDISGQRFGRLVAVCLVRIEKRRTIWKFSCDCGNAYTTVAHRVWEGRVKSCGCAQHTGDAKRTHGMRHSAEYRTWTNMWTRCTNEKFNEWHRYGGRGISVCDRWLSFESFLGDMGLRPSVKHSIDRIDPDGNYEPANCRWATRIAQANNRSKVPSYRIEREPARKAVA